MSNKKFLSDIARFIAKTNKAKDTFTRKLVLEIYSRVVLKSPVDTGRFRANWVIGNGFINDSTNEFIDKTGTSSISKAELQLKSIAINGQTIYATNSLEYASVLEYGLYGTGAGATVLTTRDGYSVQAPYGMVRITLAELSSITSKVAFEVKANPV